MPARLQGLSVAVFFPDAGVHDRRQFARFPSTANCVAGVRVSAGNDCGQRCGHGERRLS